MFICFSFPKDPKLRKIWMDATGREDWISTKSSCICSRHFTEDDYAVKKSGYKYLKEGAIPHENIIRIHSLVSKFVFIIILKRYSIAQSHQAIKLKK